MNRLTLSIACLSFSGLLASACTFTTTPDDDGARDGLGQTGGSGGGGGYAGTGGDSGAGGYEVNMVCEDAAPNRAAGTCDWLDSTSLCEACLQQDCCEVKRGRHFPAR